MKAQAEVLSAYAAHLERVRAGSSTDFFDARIDLAREMSAVLFRAAEFQQRKTK